MAGLSVADRLKLSVLMARRAVRNVAGRLRGHPLIRWNVPGKTDRLVIAPQDLRTADGTRASEIYAGRFAFAGKVVVCDGRSPFEIDQAGGVRRHADLAGEAARPLGQPARPTGSLRREFASKGVRPWQTQNQKMTATSIWF